MILSFQKMLCRSIFRLLKGNMIKKNNVEVLSQKQKNWYNTLCEKEIMILMFTTVFYNLIYRKRKGNFLIKKKCYGFLSPISVNHNVKNCKIRRECEVCKKRHSTSLHNYKTEKSKVKEPDGNSSDEPKVHIHCATANTISDVISMCVVPVLAEHKLCVCIVKTYAMVDNSGQATFI